MDVGLTELIDRLNGAVEEGSPDAITRRVKRDLERLLRASSSWDLPGR